MLNTTKAATVTFSVSDAYYVFYYSTIDLKLDSIILKYKCEIA